MENRPATRQDAIDLGIHMCRNLPERAKNEKDSPSGRSGWTRAIWEYFLEKYGKNWTLYPQTKPIRGRVAGEFMTDFSIFDPQRGYRIACESQWGESIDQIDWAFDKLRAVKAEIKILIFERTHDADGSLPADVYERVTGYLAECGNHHVGHEFYLFLQFEKDCPRLYIWAPEKLDGYDVSSIEIKQVDYATANTIPIA